MSTHSIDGREWAKLSMLKPGDFIILDGNFTCGIKNSLRKVRKNKKGLYVLCDSGHHYLDGQLSDVDHDHLVGCWLNG